MFFARYLFSALSVEIHVLLSAVPGSCYVVVHVPDILHEKACDGNVCADSRTALQAVLRQHGFDSGAGFYKGTDVQKESCADNDDKYISLRENDPKQMQNSVKKSISHATRNCLCFRK